MRDCRPSAHSASSWSPDSTTMRCGSARTDVVPAAWRTSRSGGPGSTAAGSGAHDSSGLRSFPRTPALAILVVLVITDCWAPGVVGLPPEPHPLTRVTDTAVATAARPNDRAAARPTRRPPISTSPTVTSRPFTAGQAANLGCRTAFTTVCRTQAYTGVLGSYDSYASL